MGKGRGRSHEAAATSKLTTPTSNRPKGTTASLVSKRGDNSIEHTMDSRQAGQAAGRGEKEGTWRGEEGKEDGQRSQSESEKKRSRSYNIACQPQQHAQIATTCIRMTRVATTWSQHVPQTAEPVATLTTAAHANCDDHVHQNDVRCDHVVSTCAANSQAGGNTCQPQLHT